MSRASQEPAVDPGGAPISLLLDFDGTISRDDVGDVLLARLASDPEEVRRLDRLYAEGLLGSRELTRWDMEVLPRDANVLLAAVDALPLDESVLDLVQVIRRVGGAVEIVSDGLGFHVERMLRRVGLADLPIATNATRLGEGGAGVTFPYGHPACFVCGTCKRERVRRHQAAGRAAIFVGDGVSDRYAVHYADVVFAKASLAVACESEGIPFEPWERLADVADWIELALADGRLPADAGAFPGWSARDRRWPESFICGPEVWGEGRTTAVA